MGSNRIRSILAILLMLGCLLACISKSSKNSVKASSENVNFGLENIYSNNAKAADTDALIATIVSSWDRYLHLDINGYTSYLAPDVTRMSKRAGELQQGRAAVAAGMAKEWEAFERPHGVITEKMKIERAEFNVDENAQTATAIYWVNIAGGARWKYSDQGLVFQAFAKLDGNWKITHQLDSWSLNYQIGRQQPGKETFEFDYGYPVAQLGRAVDFYTPLLGKPEAVTKDRAFFNLEGPRFILDATGLDGFAALKKGLPTGYAIFYVKNVVAERNRLKRNGTRFIGGTDTNVKRIDGDLYVIGLDPSDNIFVLMERKFETSNSASPPPPSGFDSTDPYIQASANLATAWVKMDSSTLSTFFDNNSRWFDDTRLKTRGMEQGSAAILSAFSTVYWQRYDRSSNGLIVAVDASSVRVRTIGNRTIVSYIMKLQGLGNHPFVDTAFVTNLFNNGSTLANTFIAENNSTNGMAMEFDYTGYPVLNLAEAESFYTDIMRLGEPYSDTQYRGYWSNNCVFGIYTAKPSRDGLPRAEQSNGYISFWIHSAQETYDYLRSHGATFPKIPAINDVAGVDAQPGYTQVLATDSEGSAMIFTEYTGRRNK